VFELLTSDLQAFEHALAEQLRSSVEFIEAIGDDLATAGGKRLRPSLSFLAGHLLASPAEATMQVALAVELLHSASLLHDDLIDDADTRRGKEAAFKRYGNIVSVMAGDYMLARVLGILADANHPEFTRLMSETAAKICEGEVLQFQTATLETFSVSNYFRIIEGKTAVLLAAALEGVALLSHASYGRAFQMQDDYLDLLGDEATLGKPIGGDLREGKATYPVLMLFEAGDDDARAIVRRHAKKDGDVAQMIELVKMTGADEATRERIRQEARSAVSALSVFEDSPAKAHLIALAERELERLR
jgi:octaprenyl-diphosphate synthase